MNLKCITSKRSASHNAIKIPTLLHLLGEKCLNLINSKRRRCMLVIQTKTIIHDFSVGMYDTLLLSHDVASGSDITQCNNIDKPLVIYRFSNVTE